MKKQITSKVKRIFKSHFLINIRKPIAHAYLTRDMQINPMEFLEMIFYVENEFGIELQDKDLQQIQTVADLVQCVERYTVTSTMPTQVNQAEFYHA
ncbi:MAG: acyl carrier protein [Bacteroidota bacterium]